MLKLKRDLQRCKGILEKVQSREQAKHQVTKMDLEVYRMRFQLEDWNGALEAKHTPRPPPPLQPALPVIRNQLFPQRISQSMSSFAVPRPSLPAKSKSLKRKHAEEPDDLYAPYVTNRFNKKARRSSSGMPLAQPPAPLYESESETDDDATDAVTDIEYSHNDPFRLRRRFNMFYHAVRVIMANESFYPSLVVFLFVSDQLLLPCVLFLNFFPFSVS